MGVRCIAYIITFPLACLRDGIHIYKAPVSLHLPQPGICAKPQHPADTMGKEEIFDERDEKFSDPIQQEKVSNIITIDNFQVLGLDPNDASFYMGFSEERRKRVIRKVHILLSSSILGC